MDDAEEQLIAKWLDQCVVGLGLCPYAIAPHRAGAVKIVVCRAADENDYLSAIVAEASLLLSTDIETTLIGASSVFTDYLEFNDFQSIVEQALAVEQRQDDIQLANFHPHYQFAGESPDDHSNYTNRSPLPIVQLLRTESVQRAVECGDTLAIPERNMARLRGMNADQLNSLFPWAE